MLKVKSAFDPSFFDEEERCGFVVSKNQKKIWAVELDLLRELMRVCDKYDIKIFANAGTLLGAIRHKGFIPWDDDLDLRITRPDLDLLIKHQEEFEYPYFLQHALSDKKFFIDFARFRNSETTGIINGMDSIEYNNGIYIDLCVYDECPTNALMLFLFLQQCNLTKKLCELYNKDVAHGSLLKRMAHRILKTTLFRIVSYDFFVSLNHKVLTKYVGKTGYCTAIFAGDYSIAKKVLCPIKDMESIKMVPFENVSIPVWKNCEEYLRQLYGNYMEYPPVEERGKWHDGIIEFEPEIPYKTFFAKKANSHTTKDK